MILDKSCDLYGLKEKSGAGVAIIREIWFFISLLMVYYIRKGLLYTGFCRSPL